MKTMLDEKKLAKVHGGMVDLKETGILLAEGMRNPVLIRIEAGIRPVGYGDPRPVMNAPIFITVKA